MAYGSYGDYVNSTLEHYGGDLGRGTKYSLQIFPPRKLKNTLFAEKFDVLAKNVQIPDIKNEYIEMKYRGHQILIPGRTNAVKTIQVTLYLDDLHDVRTFLDEWIRLNDRYGIDLSKKLEKAQKEYKINKYYGEMTLIAMDFEETFSTKNYKFFHVYPISVSGPEFDQSAPSSVQEITVEFAFSNYEVYDAGMLQASKIFEKAKNAVLDKTLDYIGEMFEVKDGSSTLRHTIPATVDLFKRMKK